MVGGPLEQAVQDRLHGAGAEVRFTADAQPHAGASSVAASSGRVRRLLADRRGDDGRSYRIGD